MKVKSFKTGRVYKISLSEARAFYEEHILGAAHKLRDKVVKCTGASLPIVGTVFIELHNQEGMLVDARMVSNLVVTVGREWVIDRLQSLTGTPALCDFMAIGTGTTAPAAGNTTLETEIGTRVQGTLSQPTSTTDRVVSTFAAGNGTGAITEAGRLNASSGGTLLARSTFSVINKAAGDSLQVTYDITD